MVQSRFPPDLKSPDALVLVDNWSDYSAIAPPPEVDLSRLRAWRLSRLRGELRRVDAAFCMLVNPVSLRYAVDYRCYALFQSRIPSSYAFIPVAGPTVLFNAYAHDCCADETRQGPPISFFDGGFTLGEAAARLARLAREFLQEIGSDNRRVALEYVNPTITQAFEQAGLEVVDGISVSEHARCIKSDDEIACMRWAIAVAEYGIAALAHAVRPGVSELQLWGLLNYANLANNGEWHDGRMLASGSRINPWLQEASPRKLEAGDLVGFDTDMVGPFGYFADVSRTLFCGPGLPSARQKALYRLAVEEVEHNMALLRPGLRFSEFQTAAYRQDEQYHENAYTCVVHAVGMCDEYPRVNPWFRGDTPYDGVFEQGMVICVESYVGAVGERDGVKLEEQVLITEDGVERLTRYPWEAALLD